MHAAVAATIAFRILITDPAGQSVSIHLVVGISNQPIAQIFLQRQVDSPPAYLKSETREVRSVSG